jgi:hypothetical protein
MKNLNIELYCNNKYSSSYGHYSTDPESYSQIKEIMDIDVNRIIWDTFFLTLVKYCRIAVVA